MMLFSFYFLYIFSGNAVLFGVISISILFPITILISNIYTSSINAYYEKRDKRVKYITEMVQSIKFVKYYQMEEDYIKKIQKLRDIELSSLKYSSFLEIFQSTTQTLTLLSAVVLVIIIYVYMGGDMQLSNLLTTMTFFNLLEKPILGIGDSIFDVLGARVSKDRIDIFLNELNIQDESKNEKQKDDNIIQLKDVSVVFESKTVIKDLNLSVKKGETICFIGENASGKSTVIDLISKNLVPTTGKVSVHGSIALCTQIPWLIKGTIRDNILFGNPYEKEIYDEIVQSCTLDQDIASFNEGDQKDIGENGCNLSGGQRHRISLARACYSDKDIFLIDSTFSALDGKVQEEIWNRCIKGILKNKTIIFVTHSLGYANQCDKIYQFKNGSVTIVKKEELKEEIIQKSQAPIEEESTIVQPKETIKTQTLNITLSDYQEYIKEHEELFIYGLLFLLLFSFAKVGLGTWISAWVSNKYGLSTITNSFIFIIIASLQLIFIPSYKLAFIWGGIRAGENLHQKMFKSVLYSPLSFFQNQDTGGIVNRFSTDMNKVDSYLPYYIYTFLNYIGHLFMSMMLVVLVNIYSLFFILIVAFLLMYTQISARKLMINVMNFCETSKSRLISNVSSTLLGLKTIRAFKSKNLFIKENEDSIDHQFRARYTEGILFTWLTLRLEIYSSLLVLISSLFSVIFKESINVSFAAFSITYTLSISDQMNSAIKYFVLGESGMINFKRVKEFTELEKEGIDENIEPLEDWPSSGVIHLDKVCVKYRDNIALNDINLKFGPNQVIGIVGRSGSGKSTLFSSLFRLININSGSIRIDNYDISKIQLKQLRKNLSVIPQEPMIIPGTIRLNLDSHHQQSDAKIWQVLEYLNLKDKIIHLNLSLSSSSDYLKGFSVGEKQLFSIARSLLSNARIVLMDEATSSIDEKTTDLFVKIIKEKFKEKTVLIIMHRLRKISDLCEKILVLDSGNVVEFDDTQKLLKDENSKFFKMYNLE